MSVEELFVTTMATIWVLGGAAVTWVFWPYSPELPYLGPRYDSPREINTAALALALRRARP